MFGSIRAMAGMIDVKVKGEDITVSGVSAYSMQKDIKKLWDTDRVSKYMFTDISGYSFSFKSFFLPDVMFTIRKMVESETVTSIRTLKKIQDALLEHTWLANTQIEQQVYFNREHLKKFYLTPLDFQEELFTIYGNNKKKYNLNGFLFAGSVGSGIALAISKRYPQVYKSYIAFSDRLSYRPDVLLGMVDFVKITDDLVIANALRSTNMGESLIDT